MHKPNRLLEPGRVMGESPLLRRVLPGAPPPPAGPRNISPAYRQWAKGRFPAFRPLWKVGKRRWALSGGQDCLPCARGFRELDAALAAANGSGIKLVSTPSFQLQSAVLKLPTSCG